MSSRLMSTGNHECQKKKEDVGTATVNSKTQVKTDYFKVPARKQPFQVLDLKIKFRSVNWLLQTAAGLFLRSIGSVMNWRLVTGGPR